MQFDGTSALIFDFIDQIPLDKAPNFQSFNKDELEANNKVLKQIVKELPTKDLKISFHDDVWDFNPYIKSYQNYSFKFVFKRLTEGLKLYSKFFVLYWMVFKSNKLSTINTRFFDFSSVLTNIIRKNNQKILSTITTQNIIEEIQGRNIKASTSHGLFQSVYQFYYFLIHFYKLDLPIDFTVLEKKSCDFKKKEKEIGKKLADIPQEYFEAIIEKCTLIMRDSGHQKVNDRMIASAIIFLSQTGLRLGDFLAIEIDQLYKKRLAKSNRDTNYLHFKTQKSSKANQPMVEIDIFCNALATEAFETMKILRNQCEIASKVKTLFIINPKTQQTLPPYATHTFYSMYTRFFYHHLQEECLREWKGIVSKKIAINATRSIAVYVPDTRQYRIRVCTELYNHGVPLAYIQKYMGHLSESMMGYYVRPKDTYQENIEYSERVIKEIVAENMTPLGIGGEEIKQRIQNFIKNNKFNIHSDIKAIMQALGDRVIIRGKRGGVCIKTSLIPCSQDTRTSEIMCAYNVCPNLFHFYYMIDETYLDFQTLQETYLAMKNAQKIQASQKELAKLKDLITRRLKPELNELENEIARIGLDAILKKYPNLENITKNLVKIKEEIETWKAKK